MEELLIKIILCHLVGDYVLSSDFIQTTKGTNWYHMFVHCMLYCLPFYIVFGFDWRLIFIFITHCIVDPLKARYKKVNYITDQAVYYLAALAYLF